jgi:hypothetical protein
MESRARAALIALALLLWTFLLWMSLVSFGWVDWARDVVDPRSQDVWQSLSTLDAIGSAEAWATAPPHQAQQYAQECLAGKRLVLVGDSRVRYQYLALLRLLAAGERVHGAPPGGNLKHSLCHPLVCEKWFKDPDQWRKFILASNSAVTVPEAGARERCDCFRNETSFGDPEKLEGAMENRFFEMDTRFGRISITYFQRYKGWLHGHRCFPPFDEAGANGSDRAAVPCCKLGDCGPPYDWEYSSADFVQHVLDRMSATHVLVHGGRASLWLRCQLRVGSAG